LLTHFGRHSSNARFSTRTSPCELARPRFSFALPFYSEVRTCTTTVPTRRRSNSFSLPL
jgi:hypothetical protein